MSKNQHNQKFQLMVQALEYVIYFVLHIRLLVLSCWFLWFVLIIVLALYSVVSVLQVIRSVPTIVKTRLTCLQVMEDEKHRKTIAPMLFRARCWFCCRAGWDSCAARLRNWKSYLNCYPFLLVQLIVASWTDGWVCIYGNTIYENLSPTHCQLCMLCILS